MARTGQMMMREIGTALAVLAIWLMSLLVPMHQVSRLIGELAEAGIVTVTDWSLCVPLDLDGDDPDGQQTLCPAQGIGKNDLAIMPDTTLLAIVFPLAGSLFLPSPPERFWARVQSDTGQPRAPPAPV